LIFIVTITSIGYIQFLYFDIRISQFFDKDIFNFKSIFFPFNFLINDWAAFLVCFLGILYISCDFFENRKVLFFLFIPVISGIFLTFSRGAYLSLLVSLPATIAVFRYHQGKKISFINVLIFLCVLTLMLFPFASSIISTLRYNETLSQIRSTAGRFQLLQLAKTIFFNNFIWGVGNGNFSLYASRYFENDNIQFTSRVTNSILQALCEKGVFGTLIWTLPVFSLLYRFKENKTITKKQVVIIAFLAVVLVKEMFFSTFFESIEMKLMIIILCAYYGLNTREQSQKRIYTINFSLIIIVLLLISTIIIISNRKYKADIENNLIFTSHESREMLIHSNKATALFPYEPAYTINKFLIYWKRFKETSNRSFLDSAEVFAQKSIVQSPYDFQLQSNLYWIYYYQGKKQLAIDKMKQLAQEFPYKSLYLLSVAEMIHQNNGDDNAIPYFSRAVRLTPAILENLRNSDSDIYVKVSEKIVQELRFYKQSQGIFDVDPVQIAKDGQLLLILKDTSQAEILLSRIITIFPNLARPYLNMSLINLEKGNKEQYITNLKKAELLDRSDYLIQFYLSIYLETMGDHEASASLFRSAINLYNSLPSTHNSKARNWYTSRVFKNDIIPETILYKINFPIKRSSNSSE
jgi:tetratricopeptide (TPR) repeat protein